MNAFFVIYHKVVEHIGLEPITFRLPADGSHHSAL